MINSAGRAITGSIKMSKVPPLWQVMPKSMMPSSTSPPLLGLTRISRD